MPQLVARRASHPAPPSAPLIVQRKDRPQRPPLCPWLSRLHSHRSPDRFQASSTISLENAMAEMLRRSRLEWKEARGLPIDAAVKRRGIAAETPYL